MLAYSDFLFRVVHAMGLGAAIGVERQWRQRLAGLRTNMLVSPSSALFIALVLRFAPPQNPSPLRVVAHIISGIGFLGAGGIRKEGLHVRGLHTAAIRWRSAAVGLLCGMGYGAEALISAADITSAGRQDHVVGKIIGLLSFEQLMTMVSWKALAQSTD